MPAALLTSVLIVKASHQHPSVTIDPRRHDAVLIVLLTDPDNVAELARRLQDVGVGAEQLPAISDDDPAPLIEAAARLGTRPGRCVVVTDSEAAVAAARDGGFALVVGVERGGDGDAPSRHGADEVVGDLAEITVRTRDLRMSQLPDAIDALLTAADSALGDRRPAVFYDFDGTLSDIVDDPDTAALAAGAADALRSLTARCPVAVLSGRGLDDVRQRIGLPGIWYAGSHGFELVGPDGDRHQNEAAAASIPVLAEAATRLREQLAAVSGVAVEDKGFGVAVHYRNAARERVGEVLSAVRAAGRRTALRVTTGREVIELRPDVDWDKGKTLHWVLERIGRAESVDLLPIYLGDDITDEDAFDAVRHDGAGILVRHSDDGDRATAARYALDNPARVSEFTERLAHQLAKKDS